MLHLYELLDEIERVVLTPNEIIQLVFGILGFLVRFFD
jgi:hypothetical protein